MPPRKIIIATVTNDLNYDQRMIRICTTLQNGGYQVLLVGRKLPNSRPLQRRVFDQKRLSCWFQKGKLFYIEYNIRLLFFLVINKVNIINSVDLDTILSGYVVSIIKRVPLVFDAHEYFTELPEVVNRPCTKKVWHMIERACVPSTILRYTVGSELAKIFSQNHNNTWEVIRNVPFKKDTKPTKLQEEKPTILLYQGVLNVGRGLEQLIDAIALMDQVILWIAGEGDLSKELRERVILNKVEHKVKFWGYINPDELSEITDQADIGLNLLANLGLNYYYSLANKAFDYVQSELPSIQMAFPEYIVLQNKYSCFYLLDDLSPEQIKIAVNNLHPNSVNYLQIKEACKAAKHKLNWEIESLKLLQLYARID